jgi:hypothetical protein
MSSTLISDQKLMYFPTSEYETHRLLAVLGKVSLDYYKRNTIKENILGEESTRKLQSLSLDYNIPFDTVLYDYWLKNKEYDLIKNNFNYELGYNNDNPVTILDPFAGEGKWLDSFKTIIPNPSNTANKFITIANELEDGRYNNIKDNTNINESHNLSFEELQLPKNSCSILLYNPPYGSTNNTRNTKHYLQMILERNILYNPNNKKDYKTGYMVFVIRKDDFLDSLDILCKNFTIHTHCIYKVEPDEYAKYKQYIFIARLKNYPYDLNKTIDAMDFQKQYNNVKEIIESEPEFNLTMYNNYQIMQYAYVDYKSLKESMIHVANKNNNISKNDSVWKWIKDISNVKNIGNEKLTVAKPLKTGEIVNIISSGYINHMLELDDTGKGSHVVVGGTKNITKQEIQNYKNEEGKNVTETKIIKMSKPYLNILCSVNGKLQIKELLEGDSE